MEIAHNMYNYCKFLQMDTLESLSLGPATANSSRNQSPFSPEMKAIGSIWDKGIGLRICAQG